MWVVYVWIILLQCEARILYAHRWLVRRRLLLRSLFFLKQETAYEMRISDWSSDGCSSDLRDSALLLPRPPVGRRQLPHVPGRDGARAQADRQIGRASFRERVCQYV